MDAGERTELSAGPAAQRRPTPRQGDYPQPPSLHTPSSLAISERQRADFWKVVAFCVCFGALVLTFLIVHAGRPVEMVHVMDPLGNMYAGPLEPLAESKRFFTTTAIYATNAALQRSPAGFDVSELLKLYYTPRAISKLEDDQKLRSDDIRRRNLQWKPLIDAISDPVSAGSARIVEVRGRVITAGAFANQSFYDELPFTLVLTLIKNPELGNAGAYPWVCNDLEVKIASSDRKRR